MNNTTNRKTTTRKMTIVILAIFLLIAIIGGTYARYTSSASGTASAQVAKWAVKINNIDIVTNDTFAVNFQNVENNNVVKGKIAPSSKLYADFEIDPTGSEVAVDYSFALGAITATSGEVPADLRVSKVCTISGDTETELTSANDTYVGTINLESQNNALTEASKVKVRVYIEWTDSEANNSSHTSVGNVAPTLTMQVTGTAKQHV